MIKIWLVKIRAEEIGKIPELQAKLILPLLIIDIFEIRILCYLEMQKQERNCENKKASEIITSFLLSYKDSLSARRSRAVNLNRSIITKKPVKYHRLFVEL